MILINLVRPKNCLAVFSQLFTFTFSATKLLETTENKLHSVLPVFQKTALWRTTGKKLGGRISEQLVENWGDGQAQNL